MDTYKLLIADDEPLICRGISSLDWGKIGITVCAVANNGKEAIDLASLHIPDLVLTDIRMPIVNGLDMAERVLAQNKKCKIIFLSGYEDFAYAKRALHMGAFDYILKPASPEEILETCRRATLLIRQETEACQLPSVHMAVLEREAREMREKEPDSEGKINVREINSFIEQHYTENLSLNTLSQTFNFNAVYINRMLKKETGFTFLEILTNKRMSEAVRFLEETNWKLGKIAETVGVPDQRYFSTMFKKYYGCSPKQYRQKMRKENVCAESTSGSFGEN